jgi:hypothetical protein
MSVFLPLRLGQTNADENTITKKIFSLFRSIDANRGVRGYDIDPPDKFLKNLLLLNIIEIKVL